MRAGEQEGKGNTLVLDDAERGAVWQVEAHARTDVFVVLIASLEVLYMRRQVGIDEAEAGVVEHEAHGHASFVTLETQSHHRSNW